MCDPTIQERNHGLGGRHEQRMSIADGVEGRPRGAILGPAVLTVRLDPER